MRMTMKKIIWMQAVLLTGLAAMWGCGGDDTTDEQPAVMPQVTFPVTESAVSAYVDDAVRFEAVIESPGPLSCGWFVDGKLAASTMFSRPKAPMTCVSRLRTRPERSGRTIR